MSYTTLYRFYDADDVLLYVGISEKGPERWSAHRKQKPWWTDVARTTTTHYHDRAAALEAERQAIQSERPRYNIVHNKSGASALDPTPVKLPPPSDHLLSVGEFVAVDLTSHHTPYIGRVTFANDLGFRLALYSFATSFFGHREVLIRWDDVRHVEFGRHWDDNGTTVVDIDPLAEFQERYRRDRP